MAVKKTIIAWPAWAWVLQLHHKAWHAWYLKEWKKMEKKKNIYIYTIYTNFKYSWIFNIWAKSQQICKYSLAAPVLECLGTGDDMLHRQLVTVNWLIGHDLSCWYCACSNYNILCHLCLLYSPCHLAGLLPNKWPASLLSLVFTSSSAMWLSRGSDKLTSQLSQH